MKPDIEVSNFGSQLIDNPIHGSRYHPDNTPISSGRSSKKKQRVHTAVVAAFCLVWREEIIPISGVFASRVG